MRVPIPFGGTWTDSATDRSRCWESVRWLKMRVALAKILILQPDVLLRRANQLFGH